MKRDDELLRQSMLRYLEGVAPEEDVARLNEAVRNDPAARRELAELLLQDQLLSRAARESEFLNLVSLDADPAPRKPASLSTSRILRIRREVAPRRRSWAVPGVAAAALLAVAACVVAYAFRAAGPAQPRETEVTRVQRPTAPPIPEAPDLPPTPAPPPVPLIAPVKPPEPRKEPRTTVPTTSPDRFQGLTRSDKVTVPAPPAPASPDDSGGKPAVRAWEVIIAKIDRLQGDVSVLSGPVRAAARAGQALTWGQGLETGARSTATLRYSDSTRVDVSPSTVVWEASDRPGIRGGENPKRIHLTSGTLVADVAKQAAGRPMILVTPHGEAKILGTVFKLVVEAESTRLEMKEGKVQVTRRDDPATVDVAGGFYVVVAKGVPLEAKPIPTVTESTPKGSRSK